MKIINKLIAVLFIAILFTSCTNQSNKRSSSISEPKKIVEKYMDGFNKSDHVQILSCLNDSVVWEMPGIFYKVGKLEFDKEIENPAFTGKPIIKLIRMVEEGNIVVAEGTVIGKFKNGNKLNAQFCDVFQFENGKIVKLTGYLMQKQSK
jgi:uncharacterized protein